MIRALSLLIWVCLFNFTPWLITGIPLSYQLNSDAESFVNQWQVLFDPELLSADSSLPRLLPISVNLKKQAGSRGLETMILNLLSGQSLNAEPRS